MIRSILSILAGFVLWTVLWLGSNAALAAMMPDAFREDGSTGSTGLLLLLLADSVLFSVVAGYVLAMIVRRSEIKHAAILGVIQLAVGIFVQSQYWDVMPLWYHLSFLALLAPGILVGAVLRGGKRANTTSAAVVG